MSLPEPARGPGDLEADDPAAGSHGARHLVEAPLVVGQVAHAEGDRGGVERAILDGQRQRVADEEARTGVARAVARQPDHAVEKSTPSAAPPGWTARYRSRVTLPVPQATSRARPPGPRRASRTARCRQRGSWNPEMARFMAS